MCFINDIKRYFVITAMYCKQHAKIICLKLVPVSYTHLDVYKRQLLHGLKVKRTSERVDAIKLTRYQEQ